MSGSSGCAAWAHAHASRRGVKAPSSSARFHSNPSGKCLAGRSAALRRLPIARAIGCAPRLAPHPGKVLVRPRKGLEQVPTPNAPTAPPHCARIAAEDAVQQCYSVTGEADYLLVVNVASMADYEALTRRLFEGDDNIKRFRTSVALASLKTGLRVPLDINSKENSIKISGNSPA